ncbi:hypothetical protein BH10ACI2_BH10ACI2_11660 [soil metagenome]
MKKSILFAAALALFMMAIAASAQPKAAADFSGKWNLDLAKSKLTDREKTSIESQTMTVAQSATEIKVDTETKRMAPPAGGAPAGGPPGGGGGAGGGGGRMGGGGAAGPQSMTYQLGKDSSMDMPGPGGTTSPMKMGSKWDGSKLVLSTSRTFAGPNGDVTTTTKETWELGADSKSLTVTRESTSAQGTTSSTRVYSKAS